MHIRLHPVLRGVGVATVSVALLSASASAQEDRTVDGRDLGTSQWQSITLADSEFQESRNLDPFLILRNKLPDRIQESWRLKENQQHGPLVVMFYERLHTGFFSDTTLDKDFEQVFDSAFTSRGVTYADARVEAFGRGGKAAYVTYGNTRCLLIMRIFGHAAAGSTDFSGDRNMRIFVCQRRDNDELLSGVAVALMAALEQDGRSLRLPGHEASPFYELVVRLFEIGRTASHEQTRTSPLPIT